MTPREGQAPFRNTPPAGLSQCDMHSQQIERLEREVGDSQRDIYGLSKRMAMVDGNDTDKGGGRLGRVEDTLTWLLRLAVVSSIGSIATLVGMLLKR